MFMIIFILKATLKSMLSNAVYAIRVMAVNQHGDGVKSPFIYAGKKMVDG